MRLSSIRARIMLVLVVTSILIMLIFGGIELYNAWQGIKHDAQVYDVQDSRYLASYVHMYIDNMTSDVDVVSTSLDTVRAVESHDTAHIKEIIDNLNHEETQAVAIYLTDSSGSLLYSARPLDNTSIQVYSRQGNASVSNTFFVTGLQYSSAFNDYVMAIVDPVRENNTTVGNIVVVILPAILEKSIQSQIVNPDENVIIVDSNGQLIAHDNMTALAEDTDLSSYTPVRSALSGKEGVMDDSNTWDGQRRISAFYPVPDIGWGIVVSTAVRSIYRPLMSEVAMMIGVLLLFMAAVIAVGYYISDRLISPIIGLSKTIQGISAGDHSIRAKPDRADEVGDLSQMFNEMMDELERAVKSREEAKAQAHIYVDLMGHDINNMNQVALGYLELAQNMIDRGGHVGKKERTLIDKPIESLENSSKLIDTVRKLQAIKEVGITYKKVDIGPVLEEVVAQYSRMPGRNVVIDYKPPTARLVLANELLKDVFSNIIGNAIKHSSGPLAINVSVDKVSEIDGEYYKVGIEDNGPGIQDDLKDKLFSRFARGSTRTAGKGLGLYLVKTLVESFNGRVWAEDRVPGDYTKGSRFVVMLPVAD